MKFDLRNINNYKERNRFEFKECSWSLPQSIWETYSAFANSDGGTIVLGIREEKDNSFSISGVLSPDDLIKNFWNNINNKTKVSENILRDDDVYTLLSENGETVIVINVPRAKKENKPIYLNNDIFRAYKRNGEGDYKCSRNEIIEMLRNQRETDDGDILSRFTFSHISLDSLKAYRMRHITFRPESPWAELDDEHYLEMIGGGEFSEDGKLHLSTAGLLMFGENRFIRSEYGAFCLEYVEHLDPDTRWTDRLIDGTDEWAGNLYEFYFAVINKMRKVIKIPFSIDSDAIRVDDTPIIRALREALANSLTNADFSQPRGIKVIVDEDKIVIENPGDIRVGKTQMFKGGESDPRNRNIVKMFNLIGIGERAGSGFPGILKAWEKEGFSEPIVEEIKNPIRTVLILPLSKKEGKRNQNVNGATEAYKRLIISCLQKKGSMTNTELALMLNLSSSYVRLILREMVKDGIISASGSTKKRKYFLKESEG